jgi:hypothetical protein
LPFRLGERLQGAGEQRPVVAFQLQRVVAPLGADLTGHARVAMQGVGGDDAAFQGHGFQRRQGRRHLVAARRMAARERQARLGVPDADHQRRHEGAAALVAAPQALAVDSHDTLRRRKPEFGAQRRLKPGERLGHLLGIEQTEEATEAVVARRAMRQVDDLRQLGLVGGGEIGNVDAGLGPTQSRRERNEQYRRQIVTRVEVTRIAHLVKNGDQRLQYRPPPNQEASSESTSPSSATALYSTAIPLRPRGRGRRKKLEINPMLLHMRRALRCRAKSKRSGLQCQAPAVRGSKVCRMHGAAGGAPKGNSNALKHGASSAEMLALKKVVQALARLARETMAAIE